MSSPHVVGSSSPSNNSSSYNSIEVQHHQTQERSLRCPSPPKLWIPPPQVNENGNPDLSFIIEQRNSSALNGIPNADFLHAISYDEFHVRDVGRDWRYEERRQAQEILPFMFLGPDAAARDRKFLTEKGISMCVAVRNTLTARANLLNPRAPRDLGIPLVNMDVMGNPELISAFPRAISAINEHLNSRYLQNRESTSDVAAPRAPPGKVLVFCETGNERSAAVVAAYAMAVYSLDVTKAVQLVQGSRFCVALDYQLGFLLSSFQTILEAKRDVHRASTPAPPGDSNGNGTLPSSIGEVGPGQARKRGLSETRDEDDEMEDVAGMAMDIERFANRESLAPFADGFLENPVGKTYGT